nr:hypothetical protein BaRGS_000230 [Batillaria attramentaria]
MPNIPTADVFEGAQYYSCGLQPQDGAAMASVAVSKEQYDLAVEELEKTKRYIKKLLKDGGISPDTTDIDELRRKAKESDHKRRALENMIEDERKRYSRDEQELLKRIDHVTKELDVQHFPVIERCCDEHDVCYDTCNLTKEHCDDRFRDCLNDICKGIKKYVSTDIYDGCKSTADLMYAGTMALGCKPYRDSQKNACYCPGHSEL